MTSAVKEDALATAPHSSANDVNFIVSQSRMVTKSSFLVMAVSAAMMCTGIAVLFFLHSTDFFRVRPQDAGGRNIESVISELHEAVNRAESYRLFYDDLHDSIINSYDETLTFLVVARDEGRLREALEYFYERKPTYRYINRNGSITDEYLLSIDRSKLSYIISHGFDFKVTNITIDSSGIVITSSSKTIISDKYNDYQLVDDMSEEEMKSVIDFAIYELSKHSIALKSIEDKIPQHIENLKSIILDIIRSAVQPYEAYIMIVSGRLFALLSLASLILASGGILINELRRSSRRNDLFNAFLLSSSKRIEGSITEMERITAIGTKMSRTAQNDAAISPSGQPIKRKRREKKMKMDAPIERREDTEVIRP